MSAGNLLCIVIIILGLFGIKENRGKNGKKPEPAWDMNSLSKEQRTLAMQQYKTHRRTLFEGYPQVDRFMKNKKRWIEFLIVVRLLLLIAVIYTQGIAMEGTGVLLLAGIIWGVLPSLLILFLAMAPKWQFACFLYLLGAQQIMNFINMLSEIGIRSWGDFSWAVTEGFKQNPLLISMDVASWIYVLLLLLTAVWLTLIPRSRKLASQAEEINAQMKDFRPEV